MRMDKILNKFTTHGAKNSYFLSFEGIEGAGKSTQIERITSFFQELGREVTVIREPGGTLFGEALREAILSGKKKLHPLAEAYLFASSRAQLLHEIIIPTLEKENQIIICDRYIDSSIAYQGIARNLGIETILSVHAHHPLTVLPHITFYIKIDLATSLERQKIRNQEKDYFESEKNDFHRKLIHGYDEASKLFPNRIKVIDGQKDITSIQTSILSVIKELINE